MGKDAETGHKSDHRRVVSKKSDVQITLCIEFTESTAPCGCWQAGIETIGWRSRYLEWASHNTRHIWRRIHCNVAFLCRRTAGYAISLTSLVCLNLHTANFHTGWQWGRSSCSLDRWSCLSVYCLKKQNNPLRSYTFKNISKTKEQRKF